MNTAQDKNGKNIVLHDRVSTPANELGRVVEVEPAGQLLVRLNSGREDYWHPGQLVRH